MAEKVRYLTGDITLSHCLTYINYAIVTGRPLVYFRHRWLHYMTDDPPTKVPPVTRKYILDHIENRTGTHEQYVPYSTTKPKVHAWQSPRAN